MSYIRQPLGREGELPARAGSPGVAQVRLPRALFCIVTGLLMAFPAAAQSSTDLKPLVERIAHGDDDQAAEATEQLLERVVGPLTEALAGIEARPPAEQHRLLDALNRVTAVIRLRLYRAGLPADDRKAFDEFSARHGELVESLFHDNPQRRLAALRQIPLTPGTGAGVMIVAKVYDWDATVVEAALEVAAALKDEVVVRGLTRYIVEMTEALRTGEFGPDQQDAALATSDFVHRAIRVVGQAGAKDSVPAVLAALGSFARPPYRQLFGLDEVLEALGKIGDERAVPALLSFLSDREVFGTRSLGPGRLAVLTAGDVALLALARVYGLPPEKLGFYVDASAGAVGFVDEAARTDAIRRFTRWHKENAERPREQRTPLATQPAEDK